MESSSGNQFGLSSVLSHGQLGKFDITKSPLNSYPDNVNNGEMWTVIAGQNDILQQQQAQISQLTDQLGMLRSMIKSVTS